MNELERCKPWIEAALEYSGGTHDFEHIADGIYRGTMQLWPAPKGCLVTEIVVYPKKKVLNVFLGDGELEQLADMHEDVIRFGKAHGCTAASISGREGWKRAFAKYGWTPKSVTLIKEFDV